ncbi:alpha/beta hydrolase [Brevibacillus dissolubilis]|uniref:alpha/beta hydrolase n=1 Tax=Brevibacillus dissolubilis TaxID=1844116 RepID=UPI0011163AAE|nr:alpha/beta hydrolase [Brevibacillus dissolubilis]
MSHPFQIPVDDNLTIRGDLHLDESLGENQPTLIFCHGFKGFKDWGSFPYVAEQLSKHGIATVRINFSCNGVGESLTEFDELEKFAVNTYAREVADLEVLVDFLHKQELPGSEKLNLSNLFIVGHSKGGGDAILFGAGNPLVRGIITWNGVADVAKIFSPQLRRDIRENGVGYVINGRTGQQMPMRTVTLDDVEQNAEAYDLLAKVAQMKQPLLIVQGDEDHQALVTGAQKLADASQGAELHWITGGGHTWNTKHPFEGTTKELEEAIEVTARFVLEKSV